MKMKHNLVALTLAGGLAVGIAAPATASSFAANAGSASAVSVSAAGSASTGTSNVQALRSGVANIAPLTAGPASIAGAPSASTSAATPQLGAAVRAVIAAVKRVPGLYKGMVDAVKAGYKTFDKWWDSKVPRFIKWIVSGYTVWDIYQMIRDILGI